MTSIYEKFDLTEVINASGKMTALGVSKYPDEAIEAQKFGGKNFFVMDELTRNVGNYIGHLLGAQDAHIVSSASAGIAQSVAGVIGKGSQYHLHHPFSANIKQREIIVPKGHNVDYGAPVDTMVELGGGIVVEAGYANKCTPGLIDEMVTDKTAAILYVKSHHTVQKSMLSIEEAVEVAHRNDLPLIIDAAAEQDLQKYITMGADIVIYSGAKALGGTTSGLVVGQANLIEWIRMQNYGIGRAMKIGKENILGLAAAVELYIKKGSEPGEKMKERLLPFIDDLNTIQGIDVTMAQDPAGREIYRARVLVHEETGFTAKDIIGKLKQGKLAIYTREHQANNGIIEFDIRSVNEDEMKTIVKRMKKILTEK